MVQSEQGNLFLQPIVESYVGSSRFLRRDWLANDVEQLLREPACRFVLLTSEPGAGKSTFMAQLAHDHPDWPRYFIRRDQRTALGDVGAHSFLLRIGYQLAALHPELFRQDRIQLAVEQRIGTAEAGSEVIGAEVKRILASPFYQKVVHIQQQVERTGGRVVGLQVEELVVDPQLLDLSALQNMALFDPARALFQLDPAQRIVILVDALDEIRYHTAEDNLLKWLTNCPELPSNIRFVLSSRPPDQALRSFAEKQKPYLQGLTILPADERVQGDARAYLGRLVARPEVASELARTDHGAAGFAAQAAAKAQGNLGYLDALERGIDGALQRDDRPALQALLALRYLPADLGGLYAFFLHQIQAEVQSKGLAVQVKAPGSPTPLFLPAWPAVCHPILGVLAVALEPLSPSQIHDLGGIATDRGFLSDALGRLIQFLDQADGGYRLYHATVAEFLTDERTRDAPETADLYLDPVEWNRQIAGHYWQACSADWFRCDAYGLNSLAVHLYRGGDASAERLDELVGQPWMRARFAGGGHAYGGFASDLALAAQAAAQRSQLAAGGPALAPLPRLVRAGLLRSSLASLAYTVPPELLVRALELGLWSPDRALDHAARVPDPRDRAVAFRLLAESGLLSAEEAGRARAGMQAAVALLDDPGSPLLTYTEIVVQEAAVRSPELDQALESILQDAAGSPGVPVARALWEALYRALGKSAPLFRPGVPLPALLGIRPSFTGFRPWEAWPHLLAQALEWAFDARLAEKYLPAALALARQMPADQWELSLLAMASSAGEQGAEALLPPVLEMDDGPLRQRALAALAPHLTAGAVQKALDSARQIVEDEPARMEALGALLPHLRGEACARAGAAALELAMRLPAASPVMVASPRAEALAALLPFLPQDQQRACRERALSDALSISSEPNSTLVAKALVLASLLPRLDEDPAAAGRGRGPVAGGPRADRRAALPQPCAGGPAPLPRQGAAGRPAAGPAPPRTRRGSGARPAPVWLASAGRVGRRSLVRRVARRGAGRHVE